MFTYTASKAASQALHWVRWRIGATKADASPAVEDEEIGAALAGYGLSNTSDPLANRTAMHRAAAEVCRAIAAALGRQSTVAITAVGPVKSNAAEVFLRLAKELEAAVAATKSDQQEPFEIVDSMDYDVTKYGEDRSQYVGESP